MFVDVSVLPFSLFLSLWSSLYQLNEMFSTSTPAN